MNSIEMNTIGANTYGGGCALRALTDSGRFAATTVTAPVPTSHADKFGNDPIHLDSDPWSCPPA